MWYSVVPDKTWGGQRRETSAPCAAAISLVNGIHLARLGLREFWKILDPNLTYI